MDPVANNELLARFIVFNGWLRSDKSVKQDAFIPYPNKQLSVTRHLGLSEEAIWKCGAQAAPAPPRRLIGRADIKTDAVRAQALDVLAHPEKGNDNHANIVGWPETKDAQKIKALALAAIARFVANPAGRLIGQSPL